MKYFVLVPILTMITYLTMVLIRFGIQDSLSDYFYKFRTDEQWKFILFCYVMGISVIICEPSLPFFLSGTGMALVGASPWFREKDVEPVHIFGALMCIIFGLLGVVLTLHMPYLAIIVLMSLFLIHYRPSGKLHEAFWAEIIVMVGVLSAVFIDKFF